ncbi:MAG: AraC family transcriptional regulator [Bryobacteraceae bacterium]
MAPFAASYREFIPCEALRPYVRALFTFSMRPDALPQRDRLACEVTFRDGEPFWSSLFADGHVSIVFSFGDGYGVHDLWDGRTPGHVIGPMSAARCSSPGSDLVQIGVYCHAAHSSFFTGVPAREFQDRIIPLGDLWGPRCRTLEARLHEQSDELRRIELLESALLSCVASAPGCTDTIDIAGVAHWMSVNGGRLPLSVLAGRAGVSRQYFARVFHEKVGVTPKLYSRLARFKAGLALISNANIGWAQTALELGYSDQSHMIAEFREFSGRTPASLSLRPHFHPFSGVRERGDLRPGQMRQRN